MIFTKPYQISPNVTSGYQWLPLVTNGDENAKNKRKRTKKKNKNIFMGCWVKGTRFKVRGLRI